MSIRIVILMLLCALMFASCEKDFPLDEEASKSRLTINCNFHPAQTFKVYISRSLAFDEFSAQTVLTDASVQLYEEGVLVGDMYFQQSDTIGKFGYYTISGFYPQTGKKYKVMAYHPAYGNAVAEDVIPPAVIITTSIVQYTDTGNRQTAVVEMQLQNNLLQPANFRLNPVYLVTYSYIDSFTNQRDTTTAYVNAKVTEIEGVTDTLREFDWWYLFSGDDFVTSPATIHFTVQSRLRRVRIIHMDVITELQTLSEINYDYATSLEQQRKVNSGESGIPVSVSSNVSGGYGIFGGFNSSLSQNSIQ